MKISGRHNAANALATLALGDALRLPLAPMLDELREFTGLPHRAQWVADVKGVRYINDSKGTNVGATLAAVGGLAGPLVLIAGGDGKGQDFTPLAQAFRGKVRTAVLLGRDAGLIETALAGICHTARVETMEEAVRAAARFAQPGDTVLLSPACSSLDMFRDYAHRGNVFAAAVQGARHEQRAPRGLHIDAVALSLVAAIVLLGLIMVTSASISIASKESGDAFSYLERQLVLCLVGFVLAALVFCVRTEHLEKMAWPLLIVAVALLFIVLIPGLGHVVNGSRRWIRVLGFNFQASELARVLVAHLHRELRRAARGRAAQHGDGPHQAHRPAGVRRVAAARRAGLRRRLGAVHHRVRHPVHRRRAAALRAARRRAPAPRVDGAAGHARAVPHGARDVVPRSVGRSRSTAASSSRSR